MTDSFNKYITSTFELALKAKGQTSPNPLVGCLIEKDGEVLATGYHQKAGSDHAEIDALRKINFKAIGATLYCNLEPCSHTNKKTPPCVPAIIKAGIKKVVISNIDPNPEVAGSGIKKLQDAGIEVVQGIQKEKGALLNEIFFTHITLKRPFVEIKLAQTLDGKMATKNFDSKWITNEKSRAHVHERRSFYDAILIGGNTLIKDNPRLTIRKDNETLSCPKRIVLLSKKLPHQDFLLFTDEYKSQTIIASDSSQCKVEGIAFIKLETLNTPDDLLNKLYTMGIVSVFVEGGPKTHRLFLEHNRYDRLSLYIAPKVLGTGSIESFAVQGSTSMAQAMEFEDPYYEFFDSDLYMSTRNSKCLQD
jgi:diaminohydroxyphosphoribosylaminopyrimidine deaminase/5-amino-6-(5-phosphoribosylamino)uracil reductase